MLTAPFPYYGGKRRFAEQVWQRLGRVHTYIEPFAGSLAIMLGNPFPASREIVCDTNGHICNFWRALAADPEQVAHHADWPTFHDDLTARHVWLVGWEREHARRLQEDPDYYDAKAAGWWVWGISIWIGGGWCIVSKEPDDKVPHVSDSTGGSGVDIRRVNMPKVSNRIPHVSAHTGGEGVAAQRINMPKDGDGIPHVSDKSGGQGVSAQRINMPKVSNRIPHVDAKSGGEARSGTTDQPAECEQ